MERDCPSPGTLPPDEVAVPKLLWGFIEEKLYPAEREEIRRLLGEDRLDRNETTAKEVEALAEIYREYSVLQEEAQRKRNEAARLFRRPHQQRIREALLMEIKVFVDELRKTKGDAAAADARAVLPSATPADRAVYEYVMRASSASGRPRSAQRPSSSWSSRPGSSRSSSRPASSASACSAQESLLEDVHEKLNVFAIEQVLGRLRAALDEEHAELVGMSEWLTLCLEEMHEASAPSPPATGPAAPPPLEDMRALGQKLAEQLELQARLDRLPPAGPAAPRAAAAAAASAPDPAEEALLEEVGLRLPAPRPRPQPPPLPPAAALAADAAFLPHEGPGSAPRPPPARRPRPMAPTLAAERAHPVPHPHPHLLPTVRHSPPAEDEERACHPAPAPAPAPALPPRTRSPLPPPPAALSARLLPRRSSRSPCRPASGSRLPPGPQFS
eukprot:tig00020553_g10538.t1